MALRCECAEQWVDRSGIANRGAPQRRRAHAEQPTGSAAELLLDFEFHEQLAITKIEKERFGQRTNESGHRQKALIWMMMVDAS